MLIKFKNKMTMAVMKMIDDGKRLNGIPSHIEVSPNEAVEVFNEIKRLNPPGYVITSKEGASCKLLLTANDVKEVDLLSYVTKWKNGEWKVEFSKIVLIVIDPPPQTMHLHS